MKAKAANKNPSPTGISKTIFVGMVKSVLSKCSMPRAKKLPSRNAFNYHLVNNVLKPLYNQYLNDYPQLKLLFEVGEMTQEVARLAIRLLCSLYEAEGYKEIIWSKHVAGHEGAKQQRK
jgi:hypothetical protein